MILYFLYILTFGVYFSLRYLFSEKKIRSSKEFILLFFFPMVGYGNWLYNKAIRENLSSVLPRKWFIWKKMVFQNIVLLGLSVIGIISLAVLSIYLSLSHDSALDFSSGSLSLIESNIDPTLGIGLFIAAITSIIFLFFYFFLLVIIPAIIARRIKKNYSLSQLPQL